MPAVVYYHGGDFVLANIEIHDHICRRVARLSGAVVISMDCYIVSEHKFPAAVKDTTTPPSELQITTINSA